MRRNTEQEKNKTADAKELGDFFRDLIGNSPNLAQDRVTPEGRRDPMNGKHSYGGQRGLHDSNQQESYREPKKRFTVEEEGGIES